MIHTIRHPDPMIREIMPKFVFAEPSHDPIALAHDLAQTMLENNGLGLASNQMGIPVRAFAIKAEQIIVCFNPIIVDSSEEQVYLDEGCLSFPGLIVKVKRPATIKVRYTEPNANVVTKEFGGMTARVFQHELDHLDGITFMNRASTLHKNQALARQKKLQRKYK